MKNVSVLTGDILKGILENYELYLVALGRSKKTISWYLEILRKYFVFLSQSNMLKPLGQMGSKELQAYLLHLQERSRWPENKYIKNSGKLSPFSIQGHVRTIKAFWSWLLKDGSIEKNPLDKFPLPKVPQKLIQTIAVPDIKKLLNAIDRSTSVGERLYCVLLILIDTGARIGEAVKIKISEVGFQQGILTVMGKGQKQRFVPFNSNTRKALIKFRDGSRYKLSCVESDYLFPDKYGDHVSISSIQQALRRLVKKTGISKCHLHLFRHTFATMFMASGAPGSLIKEIMGHASYQTTEKYIHPTVKDLKMQHQLHSQVKEIFKQE